MAIVTSYTCRKCGSENIQRCRVAYEGGFTVSQSNTATTGVALDSRGLGGVSANSATTTTSMTAIAAKVAPPTELPYGWPMGCMVFGAIYIVYAFAFGFTGRQFWEPILMGSVLGGLGYVWFKSRKCHNQEVYVPQKALWEKSWHCSRCGEIFLIED